MTMAVMANSTMTSCLDRQNRFDNRVYEQFLGLRRAPELVIEDLVNRNETLNSFDVEIEYYQP